jgi:hypothetical protein
VSERDSIKDFRVAQEFWEEMKLMKRKTRGVISKDGIGKLIQVRRVMRRFAGSWMESNEMLDKHC